MYPGTITAPSYLMLYMSVAVFILQLYLFLFPPISKNYSDYLGLVDDALYILIILMIPEIFNSLLDLYLKCANTQFGSIQRIALSVILIIPNITILFIKNLLIMSFVVNIQIMVMMTIFILTYLESSSLNDKQNINARCSHTLSLVFLFQASVASINYSFVVQPLYMIILRSVALICLFFFLLIIQSYVMKFLVNPMDIQNFITAKFELSIKDQELGVYLFSLILFTGCYIIYGLLLLCGVDYGLALFFLILVQIIFVLPVLYLECRIIKRLVFQLQLELESKKAFLRTTSHEIRTPMNTIVLGISLLRKEMLESGIQNNDMFEIINNLDESSVVILDLVNDLLTHDKIKEGTMSLEKTSLSLWKLVDHTIEPFHTQAKQYGINLTVDTSSIPDIEDYYIDGDKHKLSQVFRNLLSNALKFTKKGKSVVLKAVNIVDCCSLPDHIKNKNTSCIMRRKKLLGFPIIRTRRVVGLEALSRNNFLQIEVIDEGAGISKENIGRLFKEIVQFNAAKLQGGKGSGLGMMITKGILDLHGGVISAHSDGEGLGCTFTVFLPVYRNSRYSPERLDSLFSVGHQSTSSYSAVKSGPDSTFMNSIRRGRHTRSRDVSVSSRAGGDSRYSSGFNTSINSIAEEDSSDDVVETAIDFKSNLPMIIPCQSGDISNRIEHKLSDVVEEDFNDAASISSQHHDFVSSVIAQGLRILIVDDAKLNRKMLCRLIRGRCLETVEAENGFDAVEAVRTSIANEFPYDVILMDNRMPVMDGIAATKTIRELGYSGLLIGVTGDTLKDDYAAFLSHGANNVLPKPLDLQILDKTILDYFSKLDIASTKIAACNTEVGNGGVL